MFRKSFIPAILLLAILGGGCYQETTTEPTPTPTPPADDGSGGSGSGGSGETETINIFYTINYQSPWLVSVQIENHKDKILRSEWILKAGDRRLQSSSLLEPSFDLAQELADRCGTVTVRLDVLEVKEGYTIGAQTDEQDLNIGALNLDGCREPSASFVADIDCENRDVHFENTSTAPDETTWKWEFGDGAVSFSKSPDHRYDEDADVRVILTATAPSKLMGETSQELRIVGPAVAGFTVSCEAFDCRFDSTILSSGAIDSRRWDFGDGSSSSSPAPFKTYSAAGDFQVDLFLTNECGTVKATESIRVP